jgi:hypothetical protein
LENPPSFHERSSDVAQAIPVRSAGKFAQTAQTFRHSNAGVCRPKRGRPPKNLHPLDDHYQKLQREMLATLQTLKIAA